MYEEDFVLPINDLIKEKVWSFKKKYNSNTYENFLNHNFLIFGNHNLDFSNKSKKKIKQFASLCSEIDSKVVENYRFIDWHLDPLSGNRCDENKYYWNAFFDPRKNLDIKFPRELSRFQHIPLLFNQNKKEISDEFFLQIIDWIIHNPIYKGVNWNCTMDVAIRVSNWILGLSIFKNELVNYPKLSQVIYKSINDHGNFIYNNLEYYGEKFPTGNHYLSNIVGLIYIGAYFPKLKYSNIWLYFGIQEIFKEMKKQVYNDGGNYEASAGYHRLVGELFLTGSMVIENISNERKSLLLNNLKKHKRKIKRFIDLKKISKDFVSTDLLLPNEFYEKLLKMAYFTQAITKPNGCAFQFGDNDSGRLHILDSSSKNLSLDYSHFPKSVYYFLNQIHLFNEIKTNNIDHLFYGKILTESNINTTFKTDTNNYFFKDSGVAIQKNKHSWLGAICMPNGKNGEGGHNHNDKLSFELNIYGEDIIVDGGCPSYTNTDLRNSYRSTSAHSTVSVDGLEQDKWGNGLYDIVKLKEKCNPKIWVNEKNRITGSHSGYGLDHIRKFHLFNNKLIIEDFLEKMDKKRKINFNLAKDIKVDYKTQNSKIIFILKSPQLIKNIKLEINNAVNPIIKNGFYSEGYVNEQQNLMISCEMSGDFSTSTFYW